MADIFLGILSMILVTGFGACCYKAGYKQAGKKAEPDLKKTFDIRSESEMKDPMSEAASTIIKNFLE